MIVEQSTLPVENAPERLSVAVLNTSFGDALRQPDTLDRMLPVGEAGKLALVGFSEVTPGVRVKSVMQACTRSL